MIKGFVFRASRERKSIAMLSTCIGFSKGLTLCGDRNGGPISVGEPVFFDYLEKPS